MKIAVCDLCEATFQIKHSMNEDLEDIMEWEDED